jgi:hypothetical protein
VDDGDRAQLKDLVDGSREGVVEVLLAEVATSLIRVVQLAGTEVSV